MIRPPKVVIVFTGGTIASTLDKEWGGVVPSLSGGEILTHIPGIRNVADIHVHEYGTFPGPHITPDRMLEISRIVQEYVNREDVDGVVITHGTDTLEETAFFLDCTVVTSKPVIVIGAMRNSSEPDWDGPRNLRDAVSIAANPDARGCGVTVCLGGMLTAASETSKTDTSDLDTFVSFDFGPVGRITNGHLTLFRKPVNRVTFNVERLTGFIPLIKCYAGIDDVLVRASMERGAKGFVVEAFGAGNVTPALFYALAEAVAANIPVVLTSRCPVGRIEHTYAYEGAGKQLYGAGVIFADYLNGQKARIKLLCALGAGVSMTELRNAFEWVQPSGERAL